MTPEVAREPETQFLGYVGYCEKHGMHGPADTLEYLYIILTLHYQRTVEVVHYFDQFFGKGHICTVFMIYGMNPNGDEDYVGNYTCSSGGPGSKIIREGD